MVSADVTDPEGVERVITGADAVISTYGVPYSRHEITVYSQGIANITQKMTIRGIKRLVCVTSTTVGMEVAPGEPLFGRWGVSFLRNVVGRTLYNDLQRMEAIIHSSNLDWTIVRPGGLFDTADPTDDYEVGPRRLPGRVTSRADLAQTLLREATEPQHTHSINEVITRTGTPPPDHLPQRGLRHRTVERRRTPRIKFGASTLPMETADCSHY